MIVIITMRGKFRYVNPSLIKTARSYPVFKKSRLDHCRTIMKYGVASKTKPAADAESKRLFTPQITILDHVESSIYTSLLRNFDCGVRRVCCNCTNYLTQRPPLQRPRHLRDWKTCRRRDCQSLKYSVYRYVQPQRRFPSPRD